MSCKNIIWVEDFDENDSNILIDDLDAPETKISRENSIFEVFTEKYYEYVKVIEDVEGALDFFDSKFGDFDVVVLDVNLKKTMPLKEEDKNKICERLDKEGITLLDDGLADNAGYYLYLYLLCKGFPKNRIFMRTAYKDTLSNKWDSKFRKAGLRPPYSVDKASGSEKDLVTSIDILYNDINQYYEIRRIVIEACNFWIDISDKEDCTDNILFNNVVRENNKKLSWKNTKDILSELKNLCPLTKPKNEKALYLQLLKILVVPFEANINYYILNRMGNNNSVAYFNIMKLFRNWSAHNKFVEEPTAKEFLKLFIIALRAYFDNKDNSKLNFRYENAMLLLIRDNCTDNNCMDEKRVKKKIFDIYNNTYKSSGKQFSERYYSMLDDMGWAEKSKCTYYHLTELLWTIKFSPKFTFENIQKIGFKITMPSASDENILIDILKADFKA